jgi:hypothetical protein
MFSSAGEQLAMHSCDVRFDIVGGVKHRISVICTNRWKKRVRLRAAARYAHLARRRASDHLQLHSLAAFELVHVSRVRQRITPKNQHKQHFANLSVLVA